MAQSYFSLVTTTGKIKLAASAAGGNAVTITHFAIGDGGGAETNPSADATALVNEVWRTPVESVETDPDNPSAVLVKAIIPTDEGGWWMREFGIFDVDGDMIAVAKPVSQYKPTALEGQLEDILYEFQIIIGENANVTLLVDPSVLLASRAWVAARKIPVGQVMRAGYRSAEGFVNDPPADPEQGQTWVVGTAPTGAFIHHDNELAEWTGSDWSFVAPAPWFHVGMADMTDWRWDHTQSVWVAMRQIRATPDDRPWWMYLSDAGQPTQSIPNTTRTRVTNLMPSDGNLPAGLWDGAKFTCDAERAGLWSVQSHTNMFGEVSERQFIYRNGELWSWTQLSASAGNSNVINTSTVMPLEDGDTVEFYVEHATGDTVQTNSSHAIMARLA